MSDGLRCSDEAAGALAERYVAGKLGGAELERFETHYLLCAPCQEEIRFLTSVRSGLRAVAAAGPLGDLRASSAGQPQLAAKQSRSWRTTTGVGLAIAAAIALFVVISGTREKRELAALGQVAQAPIYIGMPVRARDTSVQQHFERGMRAYTERRYPRAIEELKTAVRTEGSSAATRFFLGASRLMSGDFPAAADEFRAAAAVGDTPYTAEAHYYAAKALLRSGDGRGAIAELRRAAASDDPIATPAAALADSVTRVVE